MQALTYPLAFGHWQLRGPTLVGRLPRRTVTVSAPAAVLRRVLDLCDGRTEWSAIAQAMGVRWAPDAVAGLLQRLRDEGLLVEAGQALAAWTELGHAPQRERRTASDAELPALPGVAQSRLVPGSGHDGAAATPEARAFAQLLHRRASHRTFADAPLPARVLHQVLWACQGVTQSADPVKRVRRTVASGGDMHGTRWFVLVLRSLPDGASAPVGEGLYEVRFHLQGGTSLALLAPGSDPAWRLPADPRVLQFASALVLPVADVATSSRKYGNRATLFAQLEAGQSLQNGQLMATAAGAACTVRGDVAAARVLQLLAPHLEAGGCWLPMPGLVLGTLPAPGQVALQAQADSWLRISAAPQLPASGAGPFAFSAVSADAGARVAAGGRSGDPRLALVKAEAEAWERRAWSRPAALIEGRADEVAPTLDPGLLVAYSAAQHRRAGFPFVAHAPGERRMWVEAIDTDSGCALRVPADCVHALAALPAHQQTRAHTSTSTSGMAAGTDAESALARATLELLERDAVLRCWVAGAAPPRLADDSLPQAALARVDTLRQAGHRVVVLWPPARVPVACVFVQALDRPFTAVTAAADFDPEAALHKALDEAEGRAAHAAACPAEPLRRAPDVRGVADVNRLYQSPGWRQADFYADGAALLRFGGQTAAPCRNWPGLRTALLGAGHRLLAADLTPVGASVHQGRTPLHVVRALVPGLLPIWFAHGLEPAGLPCFRALRQPGRRVLPMHPFT